MRGTMARGMNQSMLLWAANRSFGNPRILAKTVACEHNDVPYWIPFWRLTSAHRDLYAELDKRPLLSLFCYVRVSTYFVATPRGVLLSYGKPIVGGHIDLSLEPGSGYICRVAIRGYANGSPQVVATTLDAVRTHHIPHMEFMLGYYHDLPAYNGMDRSLTPSSRFAERFSSTTFFTSFKTRPHFGIPWTWPPFSGLFTVTPFVTLRSVPDNYVGADTGASIVTDKLLTDYYKGRCLVAPMDNLTSDPGFHSNSFELVPKKGQPLRVDVDIDWDIPDELITVPQRQIGKLHNFIPITKPFIQLMIAVQNRCRKRRKAGFPMTEFLPKDFVWRKQLVFENEFAGTPM
ncbi:hypothetical protein JG688_00003081 [Phytophthora aleatoria]|uniref:Uncharacterized protein n=1 Tax=Phytophthora aleatoria TaxID=2496075 RepID=A0A8J5ITU4_9STRA|nr:hypothetical protein JG688_00003081 [Phytophthora aleatoria]